MNILVVEDDLKVQRLIEKTLLEAKYTVTCANNGEEAANYVENLKFDLIILDVMLPIYSGYELMPQINAYDIPVLMLTALTSIDDKIKGYDLGVEDFLSKPFEIAELLARVKVIQRRVFKQPNELTYRNISIDLKSQSVCLKKNPISLTPMEYKLFIFLVENQGVALSRDYILDTVWETETELTRTLDLHIQRIRRKLSLEKEIRTIFRYGYILEREV
ncbi:MAG: response regulator transcription factor [Erysipelothrix sp.]